MSETFQNIDTSSDKQIKSLKAILYLLQTNLEGFKDEVDRSYELLKIGEKTDLTKKLEKTLNNPLGHLGEISMNIDEQVKNIIDTFAKSFFKQNQKLISSVYRSKTSLNELHYSIVLKEDNIDNRTQVFEFLNKFDLFDLSSKYPVFFQFVPVELVNNINYAEELKLD